MANGGVRYVTMSPVTSGDQRWVLAVDVRPGAPAPRTATADADGVRAQPVPASSTSTDLPEVLRAEARARGRVAPMAVVVVHPAIWDDERAARAADEVGAAVGRALGDDAAEWPWPVPLSALEAAAWRALEFGLLPARGRVAVVDPVTAEAGVIDREAGRLAGSGAPQALPGPAADEQLVALARRALDAAPAGPPFVGVVLGGAAGSGASAGAGLAAVVARVTGRPPLVPGDPATAPLLGAASLGWAAATASGNAPPAPRPRPARTTGRDDGADAGGGRAAGAEGVPATSSAGTGAGAGAGEPAALPGGRRRPTLPRWARWLLPLAVLVVVAGAAGLLVHRERTTPSPFTYTCPNGQVVAFSYECERLAPSPSLSSSVPATP